MRAFGGVTFTFSPLRSVSTASDRQLRLRDGRALGYAEYGDPNGKPVFYFHGFPGSRLEAQLTEPLATRIKARITAVDRPGYGLSDFKPNRTIVDWPDDITQLADALGLERFAVLGISGGGPYASVCARGISHRLTSVGIVCGLGPLDVPGAIREMKWFARLSVSVARRMPWLARVLFEGLVGWIMRRHPGYIVSLLAMSGSDPDKVVLTRPDVTQLLVDSAREAVRNGARGAMWDLVLYSRFWGFELQDIRTEVHLWHGEGDGIVPPSIGRYQAESIPNCQATFFPGEGHFSVPLNYMEEILRTLIS